MKRSQRDCKKLDRLRTDVTNKGPRSSQALPGLENVDLCSFALCRSMNRLVWSFGALETCAIRRFREVGAVDGGKLGQDEVDGVEVEEEEEV